MVHHHLARDRLGQVLADAETACHLPVEIDVALLSHHEHAHVRFDRL